MTCIVSPKLYPTKKSLRLWVKQDPESVIIENPSMFTVCPRFPASHIRPGQSFIVTNHPRRTWFAKVGREPTGELYVE